MHRCEGAPSAFSVLIESEPRPYLFVLMRFHYANRQPPAIQVLGRLSLENGLVPMTTTVPRVASALGPAAALSRATAEASARAYASGWQSGAVEAFWAAISARKPWRQGGPFVPGLL